MAKKKSSNKPHGHYCWVCGEHKANEKFSGRGHATHMCKKCHALPVAERNKIVTIHKLENMAFRYLNETEIKWLRKKLNDPNPEVRDAALAAHSVKFPRYERSKAKKGLTAYFLELFIHCGIYDEWGYEFDLNARVSLDHNGTLRCTDYASPEGEQEDETVVDIKEARSFLKSVIHNADALFWDEDLSDAEPGAYDLYLDILPEYRPDYDGYDEDGEEYDEGGNDTGQASPDDGSEPIWSLTLELNNGEEKKITFYNQMHDEPQSLFWALMEWFETDESEDFDEYE